MFFFWGGCGGDEDWRVWIWVVVLKQNTLLSEAFQAFVLHMLLPWRGKHTSTGQEGASLWLRQGGEMDGSEVIRLNPRGLGRTCRKRLIRLDNGENVILCISNHC